MSTAVAEAADAPPKKKRLSKKLIIMLSAALLLLGAAGGGATYWMKHKAAKAEAEEAEAEGNEADARTARDDHKNPPSFVPLDPFTVNLADKEVERYAQVGVTFEIENAKTGEQIKLYMPAIRNGILMILAHKSSQELLGRPGKEQLAREIQIEAARTMGYEVTPRAAPAAPPDGDDKASKTTAKPVVPAEPNPVRRVHFSNFIIQ